MKRAIHAVLLLLLATPVVAQVKTEAAIQDGDLYIRSEFGVNRYLVRKIHLAKKDWVGNQVVNFGGARVVTSLFDMGFSRGYLVSGEGDDIAPLKFNDTFIGANHGAFYGLRVLSRNHGLDARAVGGQWADSSGKRYSLLSVDGPDGVTFVADEEGGRWVYRKAHGDLSEIKGSRKLVAADQSRVQIYPSTRRVSLSISTGNLAVLGAKYKKVPRLEVNETYDILSPHGKRVVRVWMRYTLKGNSTQVRTRARALTALEGFSMAGTQAVALNYSGAHIEQMVPGSDAFPSWAEMTDGWRAARVKFAGHVKSSQRVVGAPIKFGLSIGLTNVTINGKPVEPAGVVEISKPKKQYMLAIEQGQRGFNGGLHAGDVVEVSAYRQYWPGDEPPLEK